MVAPLIIAAGVGRAGYGIAKAGSRARADRDVIKRAYKIAQRKQERAQGDTRQATNEDLNARGILNPGDGGGMPTSGPIADAYRGKPKSTKKGIAGMLEDARNATENFNQRRMAVSSTQGQQGQANTLSGAVNKDLSGEFYDEQQDLWMGREQAINATKAQQEQDTVGAIGSGIQTGMDVYNAAGAFGAGRTAATAAGSATPGGVTIRGAFGIDPVDPLGLSKQSLSGFNFNVAGQQK